MFLKRSNTVVRFSSVPSSCISSLNSVSDVRRRLSMPSTATEMLPVSSETMITTASVLSLRPTPALCRVPRSEESLRFSDSGSTQPAASARLLRMISAPSCSAALGKKMLRISSCEIAASVRVPDTQICSSELLRSNAIRAPTRSSDIVLQAATT